MRILARLFATPCEKMASFLNPLPRSFAGEIREREQAVIYQQPANTTVLQNLIELRVLSIKGQF